MNPSFKTSVLLKLVGFDQPTVGYYVIENDSPKYVSGVNKRGYSKPAFHNKKKERFACPDPYAVSEWLRTLHSYHIDIIFSFKTAIATVYYLSVYYADIDGAGTWLNRKVQYEDFDLALQDGIDTALRELYLTRVNSFEVGDDFYVSNSGLVVMVNTPSGSSKRRLVSTDTGIVHYQNRKKVWAGDPYKHLLTDYFMLYVNGPIQIIGETDTYYRLRFEASTGHDVPLVNPKTFTGRLMKDSVLFSNISEYEHLFIN